jgi:hypothetical protein
MVIKAFIREKWKHSSFHVPLHLLSKVKVVVTHHIPYSELELPKDEEIGYAYEWLRMQQRKKEKEQKKLKKIKKRMKKLTKHKKK